MNRRKSSRSANPANSAEIAFAANTVCTSDSEFQAGALLTFSDNAWSQFVTVLRTSHVG
ncbi:DUF397 domain-containing protein [Lentzea sp. NPDC051213]|uniref:DUF397 domain-containing protein n=1 Tax=Lentzea sp. NPDC051213 TaxID=3364126 RepID=UPI0037A6C214